MTEKLNLNEVMPKTEKAKERPEDCKCTYSRDMDQEYPRKCIKCGKPEADQ